jgi:hypothetical protein
VGHLAHTPALDREHDTALGGVSQWLVDGRERHHHGVDLCFRDGHVERDRSDDPVVVGFD